MRASPYFRNIFTEIRKRLGETADSVHARPIWLADEIRLLSATSCCTMGLQDRALIRVLVHTGARAVDLSLILWQIVVTVFDGSIVRIQFGNQKNTYLASVQATIRGAAASDVVAWVLAWVRRRERIFTESPYLFITNVGGQVKCSSISMSSNTFSMLAGYGASFFSAHSGRQGFGCRLTAKGFCRGEGSDGDIRESRC